MRFSSILFDLDGTLLDTAPEFEYCLNQVLKEEGLAPICSRSARVAVNEGAQGLIELAFNVTPDHHQYESLRHRLLTHYLDQLGNHSVLFPGIAHCLEQLNESNIPWGIVTNKPERFTLPLVDKIPHFKQAKTIVSGDTLEHAKPHPAPLEYACRQMNVVPSETLYVGDAHRDMEAALKAGMPCAVANYGYIGPQDKPHTWGAHYQVNHAKELLDLFKTP